MQIDPESLTRPSAPAMVGGRCHDDHLHGGVVELFSSEGSSSFEGGDGGDLKNLVTSQRVGFLWQGAWGSWSRFDSWTTAALV